MKKIILIVTIALNVTILKAQDIHFSQLMTTSEFNSVASAGAINGDLSASAYYRNQWASISKPYETMAISINSKIKSEDWRYKHFGLGAIIYQDKAGDLGYRNLNASLSLAYHHRITDNSHFAGGVQVGFSQQSLDESKSQWSNQFDGISFNPALSSRETSIYEPTSSIDFGAGVLWNYDVTESSRYKSSFIRFTNSLRYLRLGFSTYHFSKPNLSLVGAEDPQYFRYVLFGNSSFELTESVYELEPSFLFQLKGKEMEFVFGTLFKFIFVEASNYTGYYEQFDLSVGSYYRLPNDAIIPTVNLNFSSFGVGISYDINISKLSQATNGSGGLEFNVRYNLK